MINSFEAAGQAILAAEEGKAEFARMLAASVRRWFSNLAAWHARMPANLPPVESYKR